MVKRKPGLGWIRTIGALALVPLVLQLQCKKDDKPEEGTSAEQEENLTECQAAMKAWTEIWTVDEVKTGLSGLTPAINLTDVWASSANDVYVVGYQGIVLHYDGKGWARLESGTTADLEGVWGYVLLDEQGAQLKKEVFAVGTSGTVLRSNGTSWTTLKAVLDPDPAQPNPRPITDAFHDVWGSPASALDTQPSVMAVGASGLIARLDAKSGEMREMRERVQFTDHNGNTRTEYQRFSPERLGGVFGTAPNAFTAVGNSGTILQWNGSTWSRRTITGFSTALDGIWGPDGAGARIVGLDGTVLQRNGNSWEELDLKLPPVYLRSWWGFDQQKCGRPEPETTTPTDAHWEIYAGWEGAIWLRQGELSCPWEGLPTSRFEGIWGITPHAEAERTAEDGTTVSCDPIDVWVSGVNGTLLHFSNPKGQ